MEHEIEIWIAMDEAGDYAVAGCDGGIDEAAEEAGLDTLRRYVKIKAKMTSPETQELICVIPEQKDGIIELTTEEA